MIDPIEFDRIESFIRVVESTLLIDFWWLLVERGGEFLASCMNEGFGEFIVNLEESIGFFFWRMDKVEKYGRIKKF